MTFKNYLISFDDDYSPVIEYVVYSSIAEGYKVLAKKPTPDEAMRWSKDYLAKRYGSYDFQHEQIHETGWGQLTHRLSPRAKEYRVDVQIRPELIN